MNKDVIIGLQFFSKVEKNFFSSLRWTNFCQDQEIWVLFVGLMTWIICSVAQQSENRNSRNWLFWLLRLWGQHYKSCDVTILKFTFTQNGWSAHSSKIALCSNSPKLVGKPFYYLKMSCILWGIVHLSIQWKWNWILIKWVYDPKSYP